MSMGVRKVTCMSKEGQVYDQGSGTRTSSEQRNVSRSLNFFQRSKKYNSQCKMFPLLNFN